MVISQAGVGGFDICWNLVRLKLGSYKLETEVPDPPLETVCAAEIVHTFIALSGRVFPYSPCYPSFFPGTRCLQARIDDPFVTEHRDTIASQQHLDRLQTPCPLHACT